MRNALLSQLVLEDLNTIKINQQTLAKNANNLHHIQNLLVNTINALSVNIMSMKNDVQIFRDAIESVHEQKQAPISPTKLPSISEAPTILTISEDLDEIETESNDVNFPNNDDDHNIYPTIVDHNMNTVKINFNMNSDSSENEFEKDDSESKMKSDTELSSSSFQPYVVDKGGGNESEQQIDVNPNQDDQTHLDDAPIYYTYSSTSSEHYNTTDSLTPNTDPSYPNENQMENEIENDNLDNLSSVFERNADQFLLLLKSHEREREKLKKDKIGLQSDCIQLQHRMEQCNAHLNTVNINNTQTPTYNQKRDNPKSRHSSTRTSICAGYSSAPRLIDCKSVNHTECSEYRNTEYHFNIRDKNKYHTIDMGTPKTNYAKRISILHEKSIDTTISSSNCSVDSKYICPYEKIMSKASDQSKSDTATVSSQFPVHTNSNDYTFGTYLNSKEQHQLSSIAVSDASTHNLTINHLSSHKTPSKKASMNQSKCSYKTNNRQSRKYTRI